jgi:hypothetical protein
MGMPLRNSRGDIDPAQETLLSSAASLEASSIELIWSYSVQTNHLLAGQCIPMPQQQLYTN